MRRWQRLKYVQLRLVTFAWQVLINDCQQSAYKRIFCVIGGTISEDWSRFVLTTGRTEKGHFWMQRIAETIGEFLKVDWGRSRLITGGNIGGHYCNNVSKWLHGNRFTTCTARESASITCIARRYSYWTVYKCACGLIENNSQWLCLGISSTTRH